MHELGQEGPDGITEEHSLIANRFPEIGRTEQSHPRSYHRGHRCNRVLALQYVFQPHPHPRPLDHLRLSSPYPSLLRMARHPPSVQPLGILVIV